MHKGLVSRRATLDVMIGQGGHPPEHRVMVSVPPSGQFNDSFVLFGMHIGATTSWLLALHLVMVKAVGMEVSKMREVHVAVKVTVRDRVGANVRVQITV